MCPCHFTKVERDITITVIHSTSKVWLATNVCSDMVSECLHHEKSLLDWIHCVNISTRLWNRHKFTPNWFDGIHLPSSSGSTLFLYFFLSSSPSSPSSRFHRKPSLTKKGYKGRARPYSRIFHIRKASPRKLVSSTDNGIEFKDRGSSQPQQLVSGSDSPLRSK